MTNVLPGFNINFTNYTENIQHLPKTPEILRKFIVERGNLFLFYYSTRQNIEWLFIQIPSLSIISPLTHPPHCHRIPPNMQNSLNSTKHGLGTMTMTTTSGINREAFVVGQK
jgi:hypothetical protein